MKIAFIGQKGIPANSGGVDRHVESLAFFLSKKREEANDSIKKDLELISYNRKGYLASDIKSWEGVEIVSLPYINTKNLAAITHGFLATISAMYRKVDVIHFHGIGPSLLAFIPHIFTPRIKIVSTLHSFDYGNDKWGGFARFMLRTGEKMMCKYADEVIVLTDLMRDYLWQRYNRESFVIPNGAHINTNYNNESINSEILKELGLEEGKYIISVSRLIKLKGIQYLIEAYNKLEYKGIKLVIVGDGEYQEELKRLAANNANIIFTGNQKDERLASLYRSAKLFVQSSEMEGLSISLLEAMAYGLEILLSDISANREAAHETALYFKSKDVNDLEIKLKLALEDGEMMKELAQLAKERAERVYNWKNISSDILEVYRK